MNRRRKPSRRLHDWLVLLATTKPGMATGDPELFATFHELTLASREVVAAHVDHLADQPARIVTDGIASGEFAAGDTAGDTARVRRAVLHATALSTTPRTPPNEGTPPPSPANPRPSALCSCAGWPSGTDPHSLDLRHNRAACDDLALGKRADARGVALRDSEGAQRCAAHQMPGNDVVVRRPDSLTR